MFIIPDHSLATNVEENRYRSTSYIVVIIFNHFKSRGFSSLVIPMEVRYRYVLVLSRDATVVAYFEFDK